MKNYIKNLLPMLTLVEREISRTKRIIGQTVIAPLITASLYIFVFGYVLGNNIQNISGIPYIEFVFPGIFAMNIIIAIFSSASFNSYMLKFQKTLDDLLTLPVSFFELVSSILISSVIRGLLIAFAISVVAFVFGVSSVSHPILLILYVILVSILFGLIGIVVGIWADNSFEKLGIATNFIITPLSFLGGAFYTVNMLPQNLTFLVKFNPIFYAVDGIRYAFTGYHDMPIMTGVLVLTSLSTVAMFLTVYIFRTGWKIRS